MDSPMTLGSQTPEELEERQAALDRGTPFLMFRDGDGRQRIYGLEEPGDSITVGRRFEADISLPWDPEASRLHAELSYRGGEWTICDDGWSQNGTWVNGLRLAGRRRLSDGDLVKVGRTIMGFHQPGVTGPGPTMVQGELSATPRFSEQQQRILRALCKPLFADGDGFNPSSDLEVADATGINVDVVTQELDLLARLFGLEDMPRPERRAEVALLAVRSGLVGADEGGGGRHAGLTCPRMRAFIAEQNEDGVVREVRDFDESDLGEGDVLVRVEYSSVNYKDALAASGKKGQVARISPLIPGIDLAGAVSGPSVASRDSLTAGVLAHGYDLGVAHHGGYAESARVPSDWIVPLPDGLTARQAMAIGTAGYTAALSIIALEKAGLQADSGPVLVTGASGGVGSTAVDILAARGYEVVASSAKDPEFLKSLGASEVISREDAIGDPDRPLGKTRWAGAVDCVGGDVLGGVLRSLRYGAAVAACGNTGGLKLPATVLPFILRGVSLLGIDSVQTPIEDRRETWRRLADDLRPRHLDDAHEIALDDLEPTLDAILRGELQGRTVVKI